MMNTKIKFSAVGDIAFGDHPLCIGFGVYSKFKAFPPIYPFERIKGQLKNSDLLFGNLECALTLKSLNANDYDAIQMRGESRHIEGLAEAGFKVLNFANNHCMQHGEESYLQTVRLMEEFNIKYCGVDLDKKMVGKPLFIEQNGLNIAFLGYSLRPRQYFNSSPLYSEGSLQGMEQDILAVKRKANVIIVSLHWGDEFIERPSPEEIRVARILIEQGVDLIIGHHPHVVRGIEQYKRGFIVYSLGNFVCDMVWDDRLRESLIFNCDITIQGIENVVLTPVYINDTYQPEIMNENDGKELLLKVKQLSEALSLETLAIYNENLSKYEEDATAAQIIYRKKSHRYFMKNIYRFSPVILYRQMLTYIRNRAIEIKLELDRIRK